MSSAVVLVIVIVGTLLVFAAVGLLIFFVLRANRAHRLPEARQVRPAIEQFGWTFAEQDDAFIELYNRQFDRPELREPLWGTPRATAAHDVVSGVHRGRRFVAATFDVTHQGGRRRERAVWVATPTRHPVLNISRLPQLQNSANQAIGRGGTTIGHPEFDGRFEVTGVDGGDFARAILQPDAVRFLLTDPRTPRVVFFRGEFLDAADPVNDHRDPQELLPALDFRCDLLDRMPNWR
ncbi:hypothetical protein [Nocardiopsis suaedae]|uniref:DUF3137 domain-containing protein n=1 Tax=Nocardiopsis suaedae TaxID=3018444 RepID=A0ABT4TF98_9ACTN|nr:hypothetical protein [Nocardiopsis suaedae]MDA2803380.1 hypothetical protein [Nocardiopsis suaedae]